MAVALATAPAFGDYWDGIDAYLDGDYKTALREWQPLAEQGDSSARFYLGWMYKSGHGVPQDYKQAVKWLTLSAEQGDAKAQYNVGILYDDGEGVVQDYKKAVKWYRLSAEQGYPQAQSNLGALYSKGEGVVQDIVRAHMWFNISAANGREIAAEKRDIIAKGMTLAEIEKAQDLASECFAKDYKGC